MYIYRYERLLHNGFPAFSPSYVGCYSEHSVMFGFNNKFYEIYKQELGAWEVSDRWRQEIGWLISGHSRQTSAPGRKCMLWHMAGEEIRIGENFVVGRNSRPIYTIFLQSQWLIWPMGELFLFREARKDY